MIVYQGLLSMILMTGLVTTTTSSITAPATEALIISGGDSVGNTVEVFVPSTGQHCQLPDLPDTIFAHTMEEMTVCGGLSSTTRSCLTLIDGTWQTTTTLLASRYFHSSWASPSGVILIGG